MQRAGKLGDSLDSDLKHLDPISRQKQCLERQKERDKYGPDEGGFTTMPTMIEGLDREDLLSNVHCGAGHSMAVSQGGRVFTWGEGFMGKLGHGYSKTLLNSKNQNYPRRVTKNLTSKNGLNNGDFYVKSAGVGAQFSVILQVTGIVMMWGKNLI
jgi:alpha-tubulin suppressor-like RCC1 family protein